MRINKELALQIAAKTDAILGRRILIADENGLVVVGQESIAPDQVIPQALRAIQQGQLFTSHHDSISLTWCPFVYEASTIGAFGISLEDGQITPEGISLLQGLAEVIVHQYTVLDSLHSSEVLRAQFIKQLLQSGELSSAEAYRQADILKLNLRLPQAVLLLHLQDFEADIKKQLSDISSEEQQLALSKAAEDIAISFRQSFRNYQDNIIAYFGSDVFVVLKGIGGDDINTMNTIRFLREKAEYIHSTLTKLHHKNVTLGVGQYYPDLGGLRKSYMDAKLALNVGIKVWGTGKTHHIKDVGMFITLANVAAERKAELAHQILSPLLRNQQLFKTVQTFLNHNLNLTNAAEQLHVHRNTLIYRLDKTKKLINLDPRHFEDALQIKLGLMFYQEAA